MRFYSYILVFIISHFMIFTKAQQDGLAMPTPTINTVLSYNISKEENATVINNVTATVGAITLSLPFAPSPTTFVFTHFPLPVHTGSSSSMMSSARPSQSAPFPDDTIGKYGRLHINGVSVLQPDYIYISIFYFLLCIIYH